jgi:hypothetical protein
MADFFFSRQTMEQIVVPTVSDLQAEYFEALAKGRTRKAAWVRLRGYWSLFKTLGLHAVIKNLFGIWRKLTSA